MDTEQIQPAELYEALVQAIPSPIVVVDRSGRIVEWNRAIEDYTGIHRSNALGQEIWEVLARIAPATIPYEDALEKVHGQFLSLVTLSKSTSTRWCEPYEDEILSTHGEVRHVHAEIFPLQLHHDVVIATVIQPEDTGHTRVATLPEYVVEAPSGF